MHTHFKLAPVALVLLAVFPVHAQQSTVLPEVKVSARPEASTTQPDIEQARQEMSLIAGGAGIVDAEAYREVRVSTFSDTLGLATGVLAQSRFRSEERRVGYEWSSP